MIWETKGSPRALGREAKHGKTLAALTLIAAAWLVPAPPAWTAELYVSGEQAQVLCEEHPAWCVGFVTGALDGWAALEAYYDEDKFCLPADMTTGEITERFREELASGDIVLADPAAYILYERLIADHPCA